MKKDKTMNKNLLLTAAILLTYAFSLSTAFGQNPNNMSYHAVIRDAGDNSITEDQHSINNGNNVTLPTGAGDPVTDADGNTYNTVWIGGQNWMAENLRTTKYYDGTDIPNVTDNAEWINTTTPAYAWYKNNETSYKDTYGALYNWYAVETGKLCPDGWHVPTDNEWKELEMFLGMSENDADGTRWRGTNEGNKLKATSDWKSNGNGIDDYGFSAIPGGYRYGHLVGNFYHIGKYGYYWSSTEHSTYNALNRLMYYSTGNVYRYYNYKESGFSVRCVRD